MIKYLLVLPFVLFQIHGYGKVELDEFDWKFRTGFYSESTKTDNSNLIRSMFSLKIGKDITEELEYTLEGTLAIINGHSKSRFGMDDYSQGFYIDEGYLKYQITGFWDLRLGAISQEFHQNELLLSDTPFPAIVSEVLLGPEKQLKLILEQAIPTSRSLSSSSTVKEKTPSFTSASVFYEMLPSEELPALNLFVTYFKFQNIPSTVSFESGFLGNSASGLEANSEFKFDFSGVSLGSSTEFKLLSRKVELGARYIRNNEASSSYDEGHLIFSGIELTPKSKLKFTSFYNESDSSVSLYNSTELGHHNVKGLAGKYTYKSNSGINFIFNLVSSDVISDSVLKGKSNKFSISMETPYASF